MTKNRMHEPAILDGPEPCTKRRYEITIADLPLACPPLDDRVWDAHPRVYLPIADVGRIVCPYCAAEYVLKENGRQKLARQNVDYGGGLERITMAAQ